MQMNDLSYPNNIIIILCLKYFICNIEESWLKIWFLGSSVKQMFCVLSAGLQNWGFM
jgi:hypothetical protein